MVLCHEREASADRKGFSHRAMPSDSESDAGDKEAVTELRCL